MPFIVSHNALTFDRDLTTLLDLQDIRNSIDVETYDAQIFIVVVAVHKDMSCNILTPIVCKKGKPIGGYIYESDNGCYRVSCNGYVSLGIVPVSYRLKIFKEAGRWDTFIPLPESVILRHMSPEQISLLHDFQGSYGIEQNTFEYLQVLIDGQNSPA
jgi:hypothetical protein